MKNHEGKRIGVIAADPLRAIGLEAILNAIDGLEAVTLTLDCLTSKDAAKEDLAAAVLDARSAGAALLDVLTRMRREHPAIRMVVLGESLDPQRVQKAIGAGAKGFLAETAGEAEIRMAMEVVLDGSVWAPRKVLARLLEAGGVAGSSSGSLAEGPVAGKMTPREMQVLELLKDGLTNRDIANSMGIDETTVKAHLGRMLRKTGASNRVELTLRAMEENAWNTQE